MHLRQLGGDYYTTDFKPGFNGDKGIQTIVTDIVNDRLQGEGSPREALREGEAQTRAWSDRWRQHL